MKSILVIGGTGTFGSRLVRLLMAEDKYQIMIGGRHAARAEAFIAELGASKLSYHPFDRGSNVAAQLSVIRPWLVIDAAGPFQTDKLERYTVPEACIHLGMHYIDLADSRAFVTGIGQLDDIARAAQVSIISGASSVPALSMAVIAELAKDFAQIEKVDIALSASNRATAGPNVTQAILSYVGRPVSVLINGRWQQCYGWQQLTNKSFAVAGRAPLKGRWVGLCDVPDLDLLPLRYPNIKTVMFRAGAELGIQNFALWLASFAVRYHLIKNLPSFGPFLMRLQRALARLGTDRSAMSVILDGQDLTGNKNHARWTLIAEDGHGPWIPTFAAALSVRKLEAGKLPFGACPASDALSLDDFSDLFGRFHIFTEIYGP